MNFVGRKPDSAGLTPRFTQAAPFGGSKDFVTLFPGAHAPG